MGKKNIKKKKLLLQGLKSYAIVLPRMKSKYPFILSSKKGRIPDLVKENNPEYKFDIERAKKIIYLTKNFALILEKLAFMSGKTESEVIRQMIDYCGGSRSFAKRLTARDTLEKLELIEKDLTGL